MDACCQPEVREASVVIAAAKWRLRWLLDLTPSVCAQANNLKVVPPSQDLSIDLRGAVIDALAPWIAASGPDSKPFRAHLDPGGAELACVIDPPKQIIWLGSPRFDLERRLAILLPDEAGPRELSRAWLAADPEATPLDIDLAAAAHGWQRLLQQHGPPGDATPLDIEVAAATYGWPGARSGSAPATGERGESGESGESGLAEVRAHAQQLATDLDTAMGRYRPSWLERLSQWGLGLQADYPVLRVHLLRFVALLPSLSHDRRGDEVRRLLREMVRRTLADARGAHPALPAWLRGALAATGGLAGVLPASWVARGTRMAVEKLAAIFIAGRTIEDAAEPLRRLRATGRGATVDQLGELVVSEAEADRYRDQVLNLVRGVAAQNGAATNAANLPMAHVSVKVSALCAHYDGDDPDGTWRRVGPRLLQIFHTARKLGVFVHLDAEHYGARDLTFTMLDRALRTDPQLWSWPHVGIVVQAYLRDAPSHLEAVLALCAERGVVMPIRLVKGAYWDAETTEADAHGFDAPQWLNKAETDRCFQRLILRLLSAGDRAQLCIGSHNLRDHCFARAARALRYPSAPEIEHQALHATYESLSAGMASLGWAVRNYIPVGSLLVGMAYLVRRVMENASQVGVLTMARGGVGLAESLRSPEAALATLREAGELRRRPTLLMPQRGAEDGPHDPAAPQPWPRFHNHAPARLYRPAHRRHFEAAIARAAAEDNGAAPQPTPCTPAEVRAAVGRAVAAVSSWRALGADRRAALLLRAAERMAGRRDALAVLVATEAGKARREALGDVDEAIDFLRFYAEEAHRRGDARPSRGAIAVVAPWNFPLAIPTGMTVAALAAGNTALLKSAEQTPRVAEALVELLHEVGVPADVVQHLPGDGPTVGAALVSDPRVAGCVFTGSKAVGQLLHQQLAAASHDPDRPAGKLVITEMGGKNAVIVTANADLDEAVGGCLRAAFGHAGQKCSAASRVLVDRRIFAAFSERFSQAAADLQVGDALTPGVQVNPIIDAAERARLLRQQREAAAECAAAGGRVRLPGGPGPAGVATNTPEVTGTAAAEPAAAAAAGPHLVAPAVFELPAEAARLPGSFARRELFGPIVHLIPFDTLAEAIALFNGTEYALTGGVFAQSEDDIERLVAALRCGNLYVNRPITGARVAVEPFGGFAMSGTGPKAGGRDYLDAFLRAPGEARLSARAQTRAETAAASPAAASQPLDHVGTSDAGEGDAAGRDTGRDAGRARRLVAALLDSDLPSAASRVALRSLGDALPRLPVVRATPEVTHAIPGQRSQNLRDLARGPTVVLAGRPKPGPTGLAHLVAALACGAPVTVAERTGSAGSGWEKVCAMAAEAGFSGEKLRWLTAASQREAAQLATAPDLATLILDGPRSPWSAELQAAVARREEARALPHIWCADDGPDLTDGEAVLRRHLLVRTVAINTMRHGAPLVIERHSDGGRT